MEKVFLSEGIEVETVQVGGKDIRGCIACGKCERVCPEGAITVVDNLATIDYSKCTGCGKCKAACPVHCIIEGSFVCGAHFE